MRAMMSGSFKIATVSLCNKLMIAAGVRAGESVAVVGCGGVGLSVVMGAALAYQAWSTWTQSKCKAIGLTYAKAADFKGGKCDRWQLLRYTRLSWCSR